MSKCVALLFIPLLLAAQTPGTRDDRTLLPNGWTLTPAGESIVLGDLPMNAALSPDERYLAVTHSGQSGADVRLVDLAARKVVDTVKLKDSWFGIRFKGERLYVSGGFQNCVYVFDLREGSLNAVDTLKFEKPHPEYSGSVAGIDVNATTLAVVLRRDSTLRYFDIATREQRTVKLSGMPYACVFMEDGTLLVSLWSSRVIQAFRGLDRTYECPVGDHPNEISVAPDGLHAFVANANDNTLSIVDLRERKTIATVATSLYPESPEGSTTNSVALTSDGKHLLAANADNNSVTVVRWQDPHRPAPVGFMPVGWYPTKVMSLRNGTVLVLNGKGEASKANPRREYIGGLFKGTLSFFDFPDEKRLAEYSRQVYENTPYKPHQLRETAVEGDSPVPNKVGAPSPIRHVFYIIKENRTYDQVFGDMPEGNGDSSLCIFGENVSPNHHALAREFVLLDNFYVDSEVSADGHNWSTAAYATDYIEKVWPGFYGNRGGVYDFEGSEPTGRPAAGYIWDLCARGQVSFRCYGEFINNPGEHGREATARVPSLEGHFAPHYRGWDLDYSDVDRYKAWEAEFTEYEKNGGLPRFNIFHLPNDHTSGTSKGKLTPQAYVAQNDYALGLFVERISHSKYWRETAIFVIEDDAQNGPDHVDAHRSIALVISPYTKRRSVDHTLYSGSSMLRTMELILGLPPMSQYDATARPMSSVFTSTPTLDPYTVASPRYDMTKRNKPGDFGQNLMDGMNLSKEDAVPDLLFNRIIWQSIKGTPMPPPRFSIYSGPGGEEEEEDD